MSFKATSLFFLVFLFACTNANYDHKKKLSFFNDSPFQNLVERDFRIFTTWIDCNERLPVLFHYIATSIKGNVSRSNTFKLDPVVSKDCQQKSANTYNSIKDGWDRGHQVPANHLHHDAIAIAESNYMTNIIPQAAVLNRQAWFQAEEITECYRSVIDLNVVGGVIFDNDTSRDFFFTSHGVRTPAYNWKFIEKVGDGPGKGEVVAWIMPNDDTATRAQLDSYLSTIETIEEKTGFIFPQFSSTQKQMKPAKSWEIPKGCVFSRRLAVNDNRP